LYSLTGNTPTVTPKPFGHKTTRKLYILAMIVGKTLSFCPVCVSVCTYGPTFGYLCI